MKTKSSCSGPARLRPGLRRGFTLIELIIYIAISAIVVVTLLNVMITVLGVREKTTVRAEVQQNLRYAMDRINATAHDAIGLNTGASTFGSASGVLSFAMTGSTLNPTIFSLSGAQIYIKQGASSAAAITAPGVLVDQFLLTNLSAAGTPATVKVRIHATDAIAGTQAMQTTAMTLETSLTLRQ
ncbi:MAG: prepilin-type N-terminal cleavage/methylation domain-containing protein [Candidatus Peribacteraceae bacterium]|nr:prepilin-type N-terminal cleavage/methylation domain-containing protein [Candidatus Peribacteraceae bacterium]MDD5074541.1 prepilin-type N-terminal cleavage/methylation domain-containing protein [Candidatus Peribacteraceae bacterium]